MVIAMAAPTPPPSRPLRGSRLSSFYPSQPSEGPSLSSLDSAFQLQEYISLLIRRNPHDVDAIVSIPERSKLNASGEEKTDEGGEKDGRGEPAVDEACWIYEQLRRLAQDLSHPLITLLQQECTRQSCPEMKAGEWLYLCVAHGNDGAMEQCCAIDYILHTLDSATALLNSPRTFPSRISIPATSVRHFSSLARRLGRIFAHAYFHHREAFEQSEAESSLYSRFLALTSKFNLVPAEFLVIPPRMSASQQSQDSDSDRNRDVEPPRLLAADPHSNANAEHHEQEQEQGQPQHPHQQESQPSPIGYDVAEHPLPHPLRELSPEKPSPIQGSPRKFGRNRTDTMIFSDAAAIGEELRAQEPSPERLESRHGTGITEVRTHSAVDEAGKDVAESEEAIEDDDEEIQSPAEIPDETIPSPVADKNASEPMHSDEAHSETATSHPEVAQHEPTPPSTDETEALRHQSDLVMLAESKDVCDESVADSPCASQPTTTATEGDPNTPAETESKEEGLPQTQDLVMLAESEQTCDPSKHPLDLKDDAPLEASSSTPAAACGLGLSKKSASAGAVPGEGEVGPGGFVMLAEPGEVCVPFTEDAPGSLPKNVEGVDEAHTHVPLTQTQAQLESGDHEEKKDVSAESAESPLEEWADGGAAEQERDHDPAEKVDAKNDAVDHPTEETSDGMVRAPTDAENVAEVKKDGEADKESKVVGTEGNVADEANTTIEEDLVDVEKVLRE